MAAPEGPGRPASTRTGSPLDTTIFEDLRLPRRTSSAWWRTSASTATSTADGDYADKRALLGLVADDSTSRRSSTRTARRSSTPCRRSSPRAGATVCTTSPGDLHRHRRPVPRGPDPRPARGNVPGRRASTGRRRRTRPLHGRRPSRPVAGSRRGSRGHDLRAHRRRARRAAALPRRPGRTRRSRPGRRST